MCRDYLSAKITLTVPRWFMLLISAAILAGFLDGILSFAEWLARN